MKARKVLTLVLSLGLVLIMAMGCNTVRGVGKDIQAGGTAIEDATKK